MSQIDVAVRLIARDATQGAFTSLIADMTRLHSAAQNLGNAFTWQKSTLEALTPVVLGAGVAFAAFYNATQAGVQAAGDLQTALVRVQFATQATSDAMPVLTRAINDLAVDTVFGSDEAAGAFERLAEKGFNVSQVLYGTTASADEYKQHAYDAAEATNGLGAQALFLAQALKTSATDGADLLAAALNTFEDQGLSAKQTADLLAGAYLNGVPDAQALQQAIAMAGAQADTAGIKFNDFLTILDLLTQSGLSASSAGASLNFMIQSLIAPTQKQAEALSSLGIMTVNTGNAYDDFRAKLIKVGAVGEDQLKLWDGSVTGLHNMFTAAQQAGLIPLDQNFNTWALASGLLKNNLFDASGQFVGMKQAIEILDGAMKNSSTEEKMAILSELFNIRSGKAARILTNIQEFSDQYDAIASRIGKADVGSLAQQQLETFQGAVEAFRDSVTSALANAFLPLLQLATPFITFLNDLVQKFQALPPSVQGGLGVFLVVGTILSGLALVVGTVGIAVALLSVVFGTAALPILAAAAGVFATIVTVAGLVAGIFILVATHGNQISTAISGLWNWLSTKLAPVLGIVFGLGIALVGSFLAIVSTVGSFLQPVMQAIGDTFSELGGVFQQIIGPAMEQLDTAWNNLMVTVARFAPGLHLLTDIFKVLGAIIGGLLITVLGILVSLFVGIVAAIFGFLSGVVTFITGIVTIITGIINLFVAIFGTFFSVIVALVTGHSDQVGQILQDGWERIKQAIGDILQGLLFAIIGIFQAILGFIGGFVVGFFNTIVSWFKHLFDVLVGHSIIPDMIHAIVDWFSKLPGWVLTHIIQFVTWVVDRARELPGKFFDAIHSLVDKALTVFDNLRKAIGGKVNDLKTFLFNSGRDFMQNLLDGLMSLWNSLWDKLNQIGDAFKRVLGHSKPTDGPMKDDDQWMPDMMQNLINGVLGGIPALDNATKKAADTIRGNLTGDLGSRVNSPLVNSLGNSGSGGGPLQPIVLTLDGKVVWEAAVEHGTGRLQLLGLNRIGR